MSTAYPMMSRRHTHSVSADIHKTYEHCVPDIKAQAHTHILNIYTHTACTCIYIHTHRQDV